MPWATRDLTSLALAVPLKQNAFMLIGIIAAMVVVLIVAACIMIPRRIARRSDTGGAETLTYEKKTGRSAQVAQGNAAVRAQQEGEPDHNRRAAQAPSTAPRLSAACLRPDAARASAAVSRSISAHQLMIICRSQARAPGTCPGRLSAGPALIDPPMWRRGAIIITVTIPTVSSISL